MDLRQPRYSKEEHARRGTEIYERVIKPSVESSEHGRIVAIDIDTGEFEMADEGLDAATRLLARLPDAPIWCVRVGADYVHRYGAQRHRKSITPERFPARTIPAEAFPT